MTTLLCWLLRIYQAGISPYLPAVCRFHPSCSHYTLEALQRYGWRAGSKMALWRLLRCHPFAPGGWDPVPPRRKT